MYAVVEIAGKQFVVEKGDQIIAPKIDGDAGSTVEIANVLLTSDADNVQIGTPFVPNVKVTATKVQDERGEKVIVFKKKRRKGYKVKHGHRQDYSRLKIEDIIFADKGENDGA